MTEENKERTEEDILADIMGLEGSTPDAVSYDAGTSEPVDNESEVKPVEDGTPAPTDETPVENEEDESAPEKKEEEISEEGEEHEKGNAWAAKMRIESKEKDERIKELEAQIANKSSEKPAESPGSDEQVAATPDNVFRLLLKAERDEFPDAVQNGKVLELSRKAVSEELSSVQLYEMRQKALSGGFGTDGEEIAEIINQQLPLTQQREQYQQAKTIENERARTASMAAEVEKTKLDFPEILQPDSEFNKFAEKWDRDNIGILDESGKIVKTGSLPAEHVAYIVSHPHFHASLIKQAMGSQEPTSSPAVPSKNETESKLERENLELKRRLNLTNSPESGSAPAKESNERTEADIIGDLERLSTAS